MNRNFRLWLIQRVDDFVRSFFVVDCDGPIVESVPEMAEFMSAQIKQRALSRRAIAKGSFLLWTGCVSLWARKRSLSAQI